jgi:hypothetical protein
MSIQEIEIKYANCLAKIKQHTEQLTVPITGDDAGGYPNENNRTQTQNQQLKTLAMWEALKAPLELELVTARIASGKYNAGEIIARMEPRK